MKVILHKLFPYAPYLNEYIGFEMDIPDDGNPIAEVETLRKLAEQSHRERYPHLYPKGNEPIVESFAPPIISEPKIPYDLQVEGMKEVIRMCNTKQLVERQRGQVERLGNTEVTKMFNEKLQSVTA